MAISSSSYVPRLANSGNIADALKTLLKSSHEALPEKVTIIRRTDDGSLRIAGEDTSTGSPRQVIITIETDGTVYESHYEKIEPKNWLAADRSGYTPPTWIFRSPKTASRVHALLTTLEGPAVPVALAASK